MATVTFIKYQKQSAGALRGVAGYVSQKQKTEQEDGWQLVSGQTAHPSWPPRSLLPPGRCTEKTVRSGSITMFSPSPRTRTSPELWRTKWRGVHGAGVAGQ